MKDVLTEFQQEIVIISIVFFALAVIFIMLLKAMKCTEKESKEFKDNYERYLVDNFKTKHNVKDRNIQKE